MREEHAETNMTLFKNLVALDILVDLAINSMEQWRTCIDDLKLIGNKGLVFVVDASYIMKKKFDKTKLSFSELHSCIN